MRRKDREVCDFDKIISIIDRCEIIRLGLADGDFPYIVPVNFSYEITGDEKKQIIFYIHGACAGRKYELMKKNKKCSFEMDIPLKMDFLYDKKDITMRYESVMGEADLFFVAEEEKEYVMQEKILSRTQEMKTFPWNKAALLKCSVVKLCVTSISAKANPLNGNAD
jgi:uncharacterized protein